VLRGIEKFRILEEDASREYRPGARRTAARSDHDPDKVLLKQRRHRLEALLVAAIERGGQDPRFPAAIPTRTWSTRCRSISGSIPWSGRRCSSATASWRAATA
jgi:Lon protease-like protein